MNARILFTLSILCLSAFSLKASFIVKNKLDEPITLSTHPIKGSPLTATIAAGQQADINNLMAEYMRAQREVNPLTEQKEMFETGFEYKGKKYTLDFYRDGNNDILVFSDTDTPNADVHEIKDNPNSMKGVIIGSAAVGVEVII